jgi:hypothetical protein
MTHSEVAGLIGAQGPGPLREVEPDLAEDRAREAPG